MVAFEPVIGLEVHAELLTRSKMFCACAVVDSSAAPNRSICEICTGMPGTLPVINQRAVEFALRAALALNCTPAPVSVFARKNYFYPDLPKGFQISQYETPLASNGWLEIDLPHGSKRIAIRRVHLEEDTGKLYHRAGASLIDYNRSGVPLLEIVSEPDLGSLDEVKAYATALRSVLRYLEITTGDMEKGVIRFEANVSLRPVGARTLGTRTEIKNLNSFRAMLRALAHEIERQGGILSSGGRVAQQTLRWDEAAGATAPERGKEEADDYRYFPEPDLPPLAIEPAWLETLRASLPELPGARRDRFIQQYGLSRYTAGVITAERSTADYFERAAAARGASPEKIAFWLTGELFGLLHQAGLEIQDCRLLPEGLAELVGMVEAGRISAASAKLVLGESFHSGEPPAAVAERRGLSQLSDPAAIAPLVEQVLRENPSQVQQYLQGKRPIAEWLLGQVMRAARGRADPAAARAVLSERLKALEENRPVP